MCSSSSRLTPPSNASRILRVVITAGNATQLSRSRRVPRTAGMGVRRDKAALSSGCKPHPAIRSSRKQSEQSWR